MANKYKITPQYTIPTGVAGNYRKGHKQVEGVVIHASANPNASVDSEIAYMTRNYKNAFTHAWAGHDKIIEISNTDYACWGAGPVANKRFAQIETTEDKRLTKKQKLQVIDRAAYWAAVQLVYYKLPCKDASKDGKGTVWGHAHVSKYLGGTDHTDPIAYFNSVGVSWNEFYKQVERYYNAYKKGTSDQVKSLDGTQSTTKPSTTPKPAPGKTIAQLANEVIAGKHGTGEARKKALGSKYNEVQQRVNEILNAKTVTKSVDQLAKEVIDGKFGSGEARKKALGSQYNAVQKRVNEILGAKPKPKPPININSLAQQVIKGVDNKGKRIPNGVNARAKHFGISVSDMNNVQKRVNEILGAKPSVNIESIAKQVVRGIDDGGRRIPNGVSARAKHFGISIETMNKVQKRVNQLL